jgi:hypothetical protein
MIPLFLYKARGRRARPRRRHRLRQARRIAGSCSASCLAHLHKEMIGTFFFAAYRASGKRRRCSPVSSAGVLPWLALEHNGYPAGRTEIRGCSEYRAHGGTAATRSVDTDPAGKEKLGCAAWLAGPTSRNREYRPYGERIPTLRAKSGAVIATDLPQEGPSERSRGA